MEHKEKKHLRVKFTEHEADILEELLHILANNHWWDENLDTLTKINGNKLKKILDVLEGED